MRVSLSIFLAIVFAASAGWAISDRRHTNDPLRIHFEECPRCSCDGPMTRCEEMQALREQSINSVIRLFPQLDRRAMKAQEEPVAKIDQPTTKTPSK